MQLPVVYVPRRLGPLLELIHQYQSGRLPRLWESVALDGAAPLIDALEQGRRCWMSDNGRHAGFIRNTRLDNEKDTRHTRFLMNAKRAGHEVAGLPSSVSGQLVAAMKELESNIHEHSEAPETGVLAFRAEPGAFEFVVADHGIGILQSLRRASDFAELQDEGKAIEAALTDGVSRYGHRNNRGHGFRPIFTGLINLHGELRFRSGDHAITMDGTNPELATSRVSQKAPLDGFFASVRCHVHNPVHKEPLIRFEEATRPETRS